MARRVVGAGTVIPPKGQRRSWAIRFRAYGKRQFVRLRRPENGWNRQRAEAELRLVLADVERGIWKPYEPLSVKGPAEMPTFKEFAEEWFDGASPEWRERTREHYSWALEKHLLPFFTKHRISAITVKEVDRYRASKVRDRKKREDARRKQLAKQAATRGNLPQLLSTRSINNTIRVLGTILELAVEYGYIERNPARGRKRLLRESKRSRSYLQPEQVAALLRAAGRMDRDASESDSRRRQPLLAVLALGGLRISEALDLRWRDVDPKGRWLQVAESKTDAGVRRVHLTPALQETLLGYRARTPTAVPTIGSFPRGKASEITPPTSELGSL